MDDTLNLLFPMTSTWLLFAVLQIMSIGFTVVSVQRLYKYVRRYRFDESKYTLLFGFVHLRWIATGYVVCAAIWVFASYAIFTSL